MFTSERIKRLTAVGNALGLEGGFGTRWGFIQLRARLDALETAVMEDEDCLPLDWSELRGEAKL